MTLPTDLTGWLVYLVVALAGYWLRHAGISIPGLPGAPTSPTVPVTPATPPQIDPAKLLDMLRELLHATPPARPQEAAPIVERR